MIAEASPHVVTFYQQNADLCIATERNDRPKWSSVIPGNIRNASISRDGHTVAASTSDKVCIHHIRLAPKSSVVLHFDLFRLILLGLYSASLRWASAESTGIMDRVRRCRLSAPRTRVRARYPDRGHKAVGCEVQLGTSIRSGEAADDDIRRGSSSPSRILHLPARLASGGGHGVGARAESVHPDRRFARGNEQVSADLESEAHPRPNGIYH